MIFINNEEFVPKHFGDGTLKMLEMDKYHIPFDSEVTIEWHFDNIQELAILVYIVNYINDTKRSECSLILPYVPDARMDRVKNPYKEGHTLKYFCNFINHLCFTKVSVLDPHSPVTMTLLDRAIEIDITDYIQRVLDITDATVFLFPDKGARDRYSYLSMRPAHYGEKVRNWETGRIEGFEIVGNTLNILSGEKVLIVDDICAYGGTFNHAANAAYMAGADEIYLFVTHCENDILKGDLINNPRVSKIFTTNSIYRGTHEKVQVL